MTVTTDDPMESPSAEASRPGPLPDGDRPDAHPRWLHLLTLLGPAFVAAVAYVDPGNVAANITAGARYGYTLTWVLVAANLMAMVVQYQSAKLGVVTGRSLPEVLRDRMGRGARLAYLAQAELVAVATDLAEVVGGAVALHLLLGLPLITGGLLIGAVSVALLALQEHRGQRLFEGVVIALLVVITVGFVGGLVAAPPDWGSVIGGLRPRLEGPGALLVAASMLGATVMPHAIYLHSSLVRDHDGAPRADDAPVGTTRSPAPSAQNRTEAIRTARRLRGTRIDVVWALGLAGVVNVALLLLAASALSGAVGTDTIEGAHAAISTTLGPAVGVVFAVGLLASGLASTSVGAYAGAEILNGLLRVRVPVLAQRLVTLVPALLVLAAGAEPTRALVVSQVVLSFGIPFALVPLIRLTASEHVMGPWRDGVALRVASRTVAGLIIALNLALVWLTLTGRG